MHFTFINIEFFSFKEMHILYAKAKQGKRSQRKENIATNMSCRGRFMESRPQPQPQLLDETKKRPEEHLTLFIA